MAVVRNFVFIVATYVLCAGLCCVGMPTLRQCRTPININSSNVDNGTLDLLPLLTRLKVRVRLDTVEREGVHMLKMYPHSQDAVYCMRVHHQSTYCYRFSELHWGSDHTIDGERSEMELQHYLIHTDGNKIMTPLAVAVLGRGVDQPDLKALNSLDKDSLNDLVKLVSNETKEMTLSLESLLPGSQGQYYQYNGSVPGDCPVTYTWQVFDSVVDLPRVLIDVLESYQWHDTHFKTVDDAEQKVIHGQRRTEDVEMIPESRMLNLIRPERAPQGVNTDEVNPETDQPDSGITLLPEDESDFEFSSTADSTGPSTAAETTPAAEGPTEGDDTKNPTSRTDETLPPTMKTTAGDATANSAPGSSPSGASGDSSSTTSSTSAPTTIIFEPTTTSTSEPPTTTTEMPDSGVLIGSCFYTIILFLVAGLLL